MLARNDFVRQSLGQVKAPTLVVFGEEDRLIPNPFMHGGSTRALMEAGASVPAAHPGGGDGDCRSQNTSRCSRLALCTALSGIFSSKVTRRPPWPTARPSR